VDLEYIFVCLFIFQQYVHMDDNTDNTAVQTDPSEDYQSSSLLTTRLPFIAFQKGHVYPCQIRKNSPKLKATIEQARIQQFNNNTMKI